MSTLRYQDLRANDPQLGRLMEDCAVALSAAIRHAVRECVQDELARTREEAKPQATAVSMREAARLLNMHPSTVRRFVAQGLLVPVMIGTVKRIPVSQINALVAAPPPRVRIPRRKQVAA